jgi:hypothetical protein
MTPKRSEERYDEGGRVLYLQYESVQATRGGASRRRTRAKRFYLPGDSRRVTVGAPGELRKRTGRTVHGVEVRYEHHVERAPGSTVRRSRRVPDHWSQGAKVIELPETARNIRLKREPPPQRIAVA